MLRFADPGLNDAKVGWATWKEDAFIQKLVALRIVDHHHAALVLTLAWVFKKSCFKIV